MHEAPGGPAALPAERFAGLAARHKGIAPQAMAEMMEETVRAVLLTMQGDLSAPEVGLLGEIEALGRTIATARAEIAALKVDDITASHIPSATDELDAIVAHTAAATDSILEVCETLDNLAASLPAEVAPVLQDATTRIYEACGFQDITGQRITKVVAALKAIDAKVSSIITAFGDRRGGAVPPASPPATAALLNGPQLPANAMDQTDIDKLLASFD
ncbi:MAG: protein phosphatase CheZ [Rhodospirillales bacterium]|nr:protein phosphatase CheZ [Rhodospirillales bacterium]MDE2574723.1 protein phosphatase CheZ [Rhodospirillales bacterium]